jgi:aspartate aminotransferase
MNNSGFEDVRTAVSEHLNKQFDTSFHKDNIIMTVGAAGGLNVILKSLIDPEDEVIVFAPFFGEYRNYVANFNGKLVIVPPDMSTFLPNFTEFETIISPKTKAVIVNTPNNPTGVVYSEDTIKQMAAIMEKKQSEYGNDIYLLSDEPYRELVYDGVEVPYLTKYYRNAIIAYSYSKALSLPGERIGYLVIPDEVADAKDILSAANVANRTLGFVNAPSLIQRTIGRCLDLKVDTEIYDKNRRLLLDSLTEYGYECVHPDGAFYLFVKSFDEDEREFVAKAKQYNLLFVAGSAFGCPGYVRIAYCVSYDKIKRSLPFFEKLVMEERV